jgi:hypothetical protein
MYVNVRGGPIFIQPLHFDLQGLLCFETCINGSRYQRVEKKATRTYEYLYIIYIYIYIYTYKNGNRESNFYDYLLYIRCLIAQTGEEAEMRL